MVNMAADDEQKADAKVTREVFLRLVEAECLRLLAPIASLELLGLMEMLPRRKRSPNAGSNSSPDVRC